MKKLVDRLPVLQAKHEKKFFKIQNENEELFRTNVGARMIRTWQHTMQFYI